MKKILLLILLSRISVANSQFNVESISPYEAPYSILGSDINISNIQFTGDPLQIGYFNGGQAPFEITSGIVLASGAVSEAELNPPVDFLTATVNGNTDLLYIANSIPPLIGQNWQASAVNDVAILEFDFVATGNVLTFELIFGSDEYQTFVNTVYNDALGIFLAGPGISGNFSSPLGYPQGSINIATVPGTNPSLPISISTIHPNLNYQYYIDNPLSSGIGVNGFTSSIQVIIPGLVIGQTYHIRFAIADVQDTSLTSWLFLKESSLEFSTCGCSNSLACNYNPNATCDDNSCVFPGCTDTNACNFNPDAGCDNGSCLFIGAVCTDNNPNTILDAISPNCNCIGVPFNYGSIASTSISLCPGVVANPINASAPLNISDYSVQWYYKEGAFSCPAGTSTAGWIPINGATSLSFVPSEFLGTRTFACFMSPGAIYNIPNKWIPGCRVISYYSFDAQPIIGNPNIVPFSTVVYAVNPIAGNSFNWNVTNGAIISGQGTNVIQVLWGQNGPYQVSLIESNSTCTDTSSLLVVNSNCSLTAAATATNGNNFCTSGENTLIAGSNGTNLTYQWFLNGNEINGATEQSLGISNAGNYQVLIDNGLCTAVSQILTIMQLAPVLWPEITVTLNNAECSNGTASITATGGTASSYSWSNGESTSSILVNESGEYFLTVTGQNGCSAQLPPVVINFAQSETVPICLVTVNPDNGYNTIVWEPISSAVIDSYVILKETNVANQYVPIGSVPYGSDGIFEDINSNSAVQASRYKIAINDVCDNLSSPSALHKTIHLTSNLGVNNTVNLIWSPYEGAEFGSYTIYRGSNPTDFTVLATIASNLNSYTDLNPLVGPLYYFIAVEDIACDPSREVIKVQSNILNSSAVTVLENDLKTFNLYPNPAHDQITLDCNADMMGKKYFIYDTTGKKVKEGFIFNRTENIQLDHLRAGDYLISIGSMTKKFLKE